MPSQIRGIIDSFRYLQYINFNDFFQNLNSPAIYLTLGIGVFVMLIALASFRRHLFHTSLTGAGVGFFIGILVALVTEAALAYKFLGSDFLLSLIRRRSITPILVQTQNQTGPVLGDSTNCPAKPASISDYLSSLTPEKSRAIKLSFCQEVLKEVK